MYWNNREKSRSTFQGEWTRSGDKYIEDEDGYYVCCGRADDMLKVSGIYVSPFEVEAALSSHPDVLEAAVVGWHDEQKLVKPKAFVVLKSPDKASDALAQPCRTTSSRSSRRYKYPRWIEFRTELPKTATGKIQRFKLRAEGSVTISATGRPRESGELRRVLIGRLRDYGSRVSLRVRLGTTREMIIWRLSAFSTSARSASNTA